MPFTIVTQGSFTQPSGGAVNTQVNLPSYVDYFKTVNLTQMATTQSTGRCVMAEYFPAYQAQYDGIQWTKTNSTNALNGNTFLTAGVNGFAYYTKYPDPEPAFTGTALTNASPAVASGFSGLNYNAGDRVVVYNTTGMLQISGMVFTVSSTSSSGFTLLGLNASGFTAAATAITTRRIPPANRVEPRFYYITAITQASSAVVTLSEAHNLVVGQKVEFTVPASFGMVQMNNFNQSQSLPAVITAVGTYTITVNVNSTNYTAFAFPASSGSPTTQLFATVAPQGQSTQNLGTPPVQTGYNFTTAPYHSGLFVPYINIYAGATQPGGSASDVIVWQGYKMEGPNL